MNNSSDVINQLKLQAHPEGGWFCEVYRSQDIFETDCLPEHYSSAHCFSTSIYFLLDKNDFSAFHRIRSDETWHFYLGSPVVIHCIFADASYTSVELGRNLTEGQVLQYTISRNCWFAARNLDESTFSLVGCTVAPGFEFSDFELGNCEDLISLFPQHAALVRQFTRQ